MESDGDLDGQLMSALRERGYRVTSPRLLVHRAVRRSSGHVSAEQVHSALASSLPSLSSATVYATLDLLDELGFVRRISSPRGTAVYDPRVEPHHHVFCRACEAISDLDAPVRDAAARRVAERDGFRIDHAELQLSGLCRRCAAATR
jgi:Fe2+ or Zn2+ uptake regulation protein